MPITDEECARLIARVHKLADALHLLELKQSEQSVLLTVNSQAIESLRVNAATVAMLQSGGQSIRDRVETLHSENALRFQHMQDELAPIKRGVYAVVGTILLAVLAALLALVVTGKP